MARNQRLASTAGTAGSEITVTEAARMLALAETTVRKRLRLGQMAGRQITTRLWLIDRAEVERWRERGRQSPGRKARDGKANRPPLSSLRSR